MIKKLIYILIMILISGGIANAKIQTGYLEYNKSPYVYKNTDINGLLKKANVNMLLWEKSLTEKEKAFYLDSAMRYYYIVTKINASLMEGHLGLARVYDAMNLDRLAKEYYSNALNLDYNNPKVSFYFANFHYRREDYLRALSYYKYAYMHGYSKNYELNLRMGVIYEKIGDIQSAVQSYARALALKPKETDISAKINALNELNYESSQYYLFGPRK